MFVVVSYDIADDKTRNKVAKTMRSFGDRVQFSVFECNLEQSEMRRMLARLRKLVTEGGDSVRLYVLCEACIRRVDIIGTGTISKDPDIVVV